MFRNIPQPTRNPSNLFRPSPSHSQFSLPVIPVFPMRSDVRSRFRVTVGVSPGFEFPSVFHGPTPPDRISICLRQTTTKNPIPELPSSRDLGFGNLRDVGQSTKDARRLRQLRHWSNSRTRELASTQIVEGSRASAMAKHAQEER